MGAHRSEGGREWLEQVGAENPDQNPKPWNLMIKHRHVQRRGRRSHTAVRSVRLDTGSVGYTGSSSNPVQSNHNPSPTCEQLHRSSGVHGPAEGSASAQLQ
ncbi:hypothetical protein XENORESO_011586 [Xenotaenia resolanae]|uniref:Uncharacterized protein n=1 Tax=Xenotaenia resolanae TaxID=208358 RepID=A0ABV0VQX7_9TELE